MVLLRPWARPISTAAQRLNYAFAFDIDGVLIKGKRTIPQANKALRLLNGDNPRQRKVPFVLLTNGGGMTEASKAEQISDMVGVKIDPDQVIMSHSPMQALAKKYKERRVLVVGGKGDACTRLAQGYGFEKVVTPNDVHLWNTSLWPYSQPTGEPRVNVDFSKEPVEAVMVFHDSYDWGRDLQTTLDAVCSQDGIMTTTKSDFSTQTMPLYFSNNDLVWSTDYPVNRLGQGGFKVALEGLYHTLTGQPLQSTSYGKPHGTTYAFAEQVISRQVQRQTGQVYVPTHVYAIGDNPAADIKGANAHGWSSILVKSGVFKGPGNSPLYPADHVCDNVLDAVQWALAQEE
ncbi:HAD-superfamily hydrolase [Hesseltinella vesiculosa]|uniref:HAD-superfamily hydrolase n=1 Tax=Hesseltinella vesiculosa TaxID=101127 RepID=A0A1X2GYB1_9FUNG|nr:HAD-superfamily hydrolase [Hesseltinella vesiculosa]